MIAFCRCVGFVNFKAQIIRLNVEFFYDVIGYVCFVIRAGQLFNKLAKQNIAKIRICIFFIGF